MQYLESKQLFPMNDFRTLNEMLERTFQAHSEQTAVVYRLNPTDEAQYVTYRQMQDDYLAVQQGLADLLPGERRIAVSGGNSYFWMLSYLAAVTGLGTVIPLDRLLRPDETVGLLNRSEADTLVCDASIYLELLSSDAWDDLTHLRQVVVMLPERLNEPQRQELEALLVSQSDRLSTFAEVLELGRDIISSGAARAFAEPDPEASLILLFTSGTTAHSKGVLLSHRSIGANINGLEGVIRLPEAVRMLSVLPLNHVFESTCGFLFALNIGAQICINDGYRFVQQNMQEYKIQMMIAVPALFEAFYKRIIANAKKTGQLKKLKFGLKLSRFLRRIGIDRRRQIFTSVHEGLGSEFSMAIAGAAPMNLEIIHFFDDIGIKIMQGYGLTETSPVVAGNTQELVAGSVGLGLPGNEVAIANDQAGETGEILVRGPIVMNGYYRDPEATAEVMDEDGWFHTGDLGSIDARTGCLTIRGRSKSVIVLENGKKIFPEELEQLINQTGQDLVKDLLVFGQMDERDHIVIVAKLVLDRESVDKLDMSGNQRSIQDYLDELIKTVNARVPAFKRINTYVYSYKDMIQTTTLKVKRPAEIEAFTRNLQEHGLRLKDVSGKLFENS